MAAAGCARRHDASADKTALFFGVIALSPALDPGRGNPPDQRASGATIIRHSVDATVSWYTMITRRRTNPANLSLDVEQRYEWLAITLTAKEARQWDAIKEASEVSDATLLHEAIAEVLAAHGQALPAPLVEYLETHGRPLPPRARRAPKTYKFH